jgi:hypothetical protein
MAAVSSSETLVNISTRTDVTTPQKTDIFKLTMSCNFFKKRYDCVVQFPVRIKILTAHGNDKRQDHDVKRHLLGLLASA